MRICSPLVWTVLVLVLKAAGAEELALRELEMWTWLYVPSMPRESGSVPVLVTSLT